MAQPNVLTKDPIEATEVDSSSQNDSSLYGLPYWLGIGEFFLDQENINKKYEGYWDYDKIYSLLRSWALEINPNLDENTPLLEIIKTLRNPENARAIIESNTISPEQVKYLLEQLEKAGQTSKEAAENAQKIKRAFMASLVREAEIRNTYHRFSENALHNITTSPIEPSQIEKVAQTISRNLLMNETDIIAAIKAKDSTEPEAEQNLLIRQREIWENAIARAASRLERDGTPLSQDQIKYLEAVPSELVFDRLIELQVQEAALQTQAIAEKPNLQTGELKAKAFSAIKEALVSTTETNESAIQPLQRERVARAITDNLEIDQILTNEARWDEAIDRAAIQLRLGPEQVSYLKAIPSEVVLEQIARAITEETAAQKQDQGTLFKADATGLNRKIIPLIEEALKPTQSSRVKTVVAQMAPLVFVNTQPELGVNPKTASVKSIMVVQVKIQQEAILSLSQIAPALVEKGIVLTPIETAKVLAAFSLTESEVRALLKTPFLTKGPIDKAVIFQTKEIGPIEISQDIPVVSSHLSRISPYNLRTESGKTLGRELKDVLLAKGINRESVPAITERIDRLMAIGVISAGLSPQILEKSRQERLRAGMPPNSPLDNEYKHLIKITRKYLDEENPSQLRSLPKSVKPGNYPVPRSNISVSASRPLTAGRNFFTTTGSFVSKLLGGQRASFIQKNLVILTNPISFFRTKISSFIGNAFSKTSIGKAFAGMAKNQSFTFLQKLWGAGSKGAVSKGITAFLAKVGITLASNVAAPIVAAIAFLGPTLKKLAFGTIKKLGNALLTGFGFADSLFSSLTSYRSSEKESKVVTIISVGAVIFVLLFLPFFSMLFVGVSFVSKIESLFESRGGNVSTLPPECQNTRHFAESVICTVSYGTSSPCNHHFVTRDYIDDVTACLFSSNLTNKSLINGIFTQSARSFGGLQCTAFVDAVQKAIGKDMGDLKNACEYYTNPPSGYTLIQATATSNPRAGDVAVWNEGYCKGRSKSTAAYFGHMAIVIQVDYGIIIVAEANGITGEIRIVSYPYGHPDNSTDPSGFLR